MKNAITALAALALISVFSCTQPGPDKGPGDSSKPKEPSAKKAAKVMAPAAEPTFKLDSSAIYSWEDVNITFNKPLPRAKGVKYCITIVKQGTPDRDKGDYFPMDIGTTWARKSAPRKGGAYEVRLISETPDQGLRVLCRRTLTVKDAYQAFMEGNTSLLKKRITSSWDNGQPRSIRYYMEGEHLRQEVREESFYENGQMQDQVNYEDGRQAGPYKAWYPSGQIMIESTYKDGAMDGKYTEYRDDGSVYCQGNLSAGYGQLECMDLYGNVDHNEMYGSGRQWRLTHQAQEAQ